MLSLDLLGLLGLSSVFFMFDWKEHEAWMKMPMSGFHSSFIKHKQQQELEQIENKYRDKNDPESKQKEIDELLVFMDKLLKHMSYRKVFSRNPEEQTELEKMIINAPPPPPGTDAKKEFGKYLVKDPETGMYFHKVSGTPEYSPEMNREYWDYAIEKTIGYKWDDNKNWFYNVMMFVLKGNG
jgi:hypothetical protein